MSPQAWARGPLRSHLGASFGALHGLRSEMLEAVSPGGDPGRLPVVLARLSDHLTAEVAWLQSLMPIPEGMRRSERARYLAAHGQAVGEVMRSLADATAVRPLDPERFDTFGVALLALLAREEGARRL